MMEYHWFGLDYLCKQLIISIPENKIKQTLKNSISMISFKVVPKYFLKYICIYVMK